jgi:hypothetical protein
MLLAEELAGCGVELIFLERPPALPPNRPNPLLAHVTFCVPTVYTLDFEHVRAGIEQNVKAPLNY